MRPKMSMRSFCFPKTATSERSILQFGLPVGFFWIQQKTLLDQDKLWDSLGLLLHVKQRSSVEELPVSVLFRETETPFRDQRHSWLDVSCCIPR